MVDGLGRDPQAVFLMRRDEKEGRRLTRMHADFFDLRLSENICVPSRVSLALPAGFEDGPDHLPQGDPDDHAFAHVAALVGQPQE